MKDPNRKIKNKLPHTVSMTLTERLNLAINLTTGTIKNNNSQTLLDMLSRP